MIFPSRMSKLYVRGLVVANACEHITQRQFFTPEVRCFIHHVCLPRALQKWVSQIPTVLTTENRQCLLHCNYLRVPKTFLHLFRASLQTQPPQDKLHGRAKIFPCPPRFRICSIKSQNVFMHYALNKSWSLL